MVSFSDFCAGSVFTSALLDPTPLCTRLPAAAPQAAQPPAISVWYLCQSSRTLLQPRGGWLCPASLGSDGQQGSRGLCAARDPLQGPLCPPVLPRSRKGARHWEGPHGSVCG